MFEALTSRARTWHPELADENERTAQQKLRAAITGYDGLIGDSAFNTALTALRQHRDDYVAHNLVRMGDREPLLFGYLADVLSGAEIKNSAPCGWARNGRAFERAGLCEKKHGESPPCFTARNSRFLQLYYSCVCAHRRYDPRQFAGGQHRLLTVSNLQ
jgi:hypothetical protein